MLGVMCRGASEVGGSRYPLLLGRATWVGIKVLLPITSAALNVVFSI